MKLAFLIFKYFPYGGMQRDFIRTVAVCQERGHDVRIYTMCWEDGIPENYQVTIVPSGGLSNHRRAVNFIAKVQPLLKAENYDAVIGFNRMPHLDVCFAADLCFVESAKRHHPLLNCLSNRYRVFSALERDVFKPEAKTQIMVISEQQQAQYRACYQTPAERFTLLPPGLDPNRKAPENADHVRKQFRTEYGFQDDQHLVLMIASNFQLKGVDRAIRALAALPKGLRRNTYLWVVGKGQPKVFERLASRLRIGSQISFRGGCNQVSRYLLAADILIHPARREAGGLVLLEAMANGLPILATQHCGFSYHVDKAEAGILLSKPFQQKSLNQRLETMLTSPEKSRWRLNGLRYADQTDLYHCSEKAADVIENIARNPRR